MRGINACFFNGLYSLSNPRPHDCVIWSGILASVAYYLSNGQPVRTRHVDRTENSHKEKLMVAFANIDAVYAAIETIHWKCTDRGLSLAPQHLINS